MADLRGPMPLAQLLTAANLRLLGPGRLRAWSRAGINRARRLLALAGDPAVSCTVAGVELLVPVSHDLPYILAQRPDYGGALGRLGALLAAEDPAAPVVDVGANVGDTAAQLRARAPLPVLCIEGSERFFAFLRANLPRLGSGVELERTLLGPRDEERKVALREAEGTARLEAAGAPAKLERLETVLARHPRFARPRLVKLDTDGQDLELLEAWLPLLRAVQPALVFEYDPALFGEQARPLALLAALRDAGYRRCAVHDNGGDYLLTVALGDRTALEDLHGWFSGRGGLRYADLTLFADRDLGLAERFRQGELAHFAGRRGR